jgi:LysR family tcuABC transcriptional regulator
MRPEAWPNRCELMELRQLRYFVRVVELGSMGRASAELGVVTSALSQQISRLEGELSTRLLQRTAAGVHTTDAGLAFLRQAQLVLRHADAAVTAAQQARLSGHVSVGLAPTTASVLGLPLMRAMRERYPDVRLHLVESLSGHLAAMLNARQIDLAVLFKTEAARRWSVLPLLHERLFVIAATALPGLAEAGLASGGSRALRLARLGRLPLILPSGPHGLRSTIDAACAQARAVPNIVMEIDSLTLLMDAVAAGLGATLQPGAATARLEGRGPATSARAGGGGLLIRAVADPAASRHNLLVSLSDDELSPAGLATRVVLAEVARGLVTQGRWPGAALHEG